MIGILSDEGAIDKNNFECNSNNLGRVTIKIPILVKQMSDKEYDILIDYKYHIGDMINPSCNMSVSGTTINVSYSDNDGCSGINYYLVKSSNVDWTFDENGNSTISINRNGDYLFNVMDKAGNSNSCSLNVNSTISADCDCYEKAVGMEACEKNVVIWE